MRHFDASEFVDFVDGRLAADRARHADDCDACRAQAAAVGETLGALRAEQAPEPSPLFWEHLSARIGEALDNEPLPQSAWLAWLPGGRPRIAFAALALVLVAAVAGFVGWTWRAATLHDTPSGVVADDVAGVPAIDDALGGEAWDVIAAAADDLDVDEVQAAGISARPGTAERVALELTPEEQLEFARLLEDEMKKHGA